MESLGISSTYQANLPDRPLAAVRIRAAAGNPSRGWLTAGGHTVPVALGRGGIRANKREGDGGTPRGTFRPRQLWWRADRYPRPRTFLPVRAIGPEDAWCENPASRHYNQPMRLGSEASGDRLKRDDQLYDFIIEIDHNTLPRVIGTWQRGIFASRAREFRPHRRMRIDDQGSHAEAVGTNRPRDEDCD